MISLGRILVVGEEPQLRQLIRNVLNRAGYLIFEASAGGEALSRLDKELPHLILMDLDYSDASGMKVLSSVREISEAPIIILSSRSSEKDKVCAFEAGADDYVTKPFGCEELSARINAFFRRIHLSTGNSLQCLKSGDLVIDFQSRKAKVREREVRLTPKEYDLLQYLASHAGKPVRHRRLLQAVWGPDCGNEIECLRVCINQLRKKIEADARNPQYIITEPWVGYRFENNDSTSKNYDPGQSPATNYE
jgi:two-component system, OmpR family, KDP operon response regulator KdpE